MIDAIPTQSDHCARCGGEGYLVMTYLGRPVGQLPCDECRAYDRAMMFRSIVQMAVDKEQTAFDEGPGKAKQ